MDYIVDIIDTLDDTHVLSLEQAIASSILLNYNGADSKDDLFIVGSSLKFTLTHTDLIDAKFGVLFTGDETRYRVELYTEVGGTLVWTGFLLPDSYSEPYTNGVTVVELEAVDGLGRLQGKFLPDDFYTDEKSVIQILSKCVELTGLQLDLYFSAAIENKTVKDYDLIYINTAHFKSKTTKKTAYSILYQLMHDMVCVCYQANDRWYIEGLNKRHKKITAYKKYNYQGVYQSDVNEERLIKSLIPLATPVITMVPPYNKITIKNKRVIKSLPDTIAKEKNEGWAITTGVFEGVYATDWFGAGGFYPMAMAPEYEIMLLSVKTGTFDSSKYMSLKEKIYVEKGDKFKFAIKFYNWEAKDYPPNAVTDIVDRGDWDDVIIVDLIIAGEIYSSNNLSFNTSLTASVEFDIVVENAGLMDIKIYPPFKYTQFNISKVQITRLVLEQVGFEEEETFEDAINDDYTIDKTMEIIFADDVSAFSSSFQLAKLKEKTAAYNEQSFEVLYGFIQNDTYYSQVTLPGANVIADNINSVYYNDSLLADLEVIYNYNNGEQMVIVTPAPITTGDFVVRVYAVDDHTADRTHWQQWTDAIYQIEKLRYAEVVAEIYRRLFIIPHQKIDFIVKGAVKFNDLVKFKYLLPANYIITNCSWDIDAGETMISMVKGFYQNDDVVAPGDTLPPVVQAGDNINIGNSDTTADLDSTSYSPDGWIVSYLWEKLNGTGGVIDTATLEDTGLSSLTDDLYEYKITVTDNEGLTASDTVKVIRVSDYVLSLSTISETGDLFQRRSIFEIVIDPDLPSNFSVKLSGDYKLIADKNNNFNSAAGELRIYKNGVKIFEKLNSGDYAITETGAFEFNFITGDVIQFDLWVEATIDDQESSGSAYGQADFNITAFTFNAGEGTITGLPQGRSINIDSA